MYSNLSKKEKQKKLVQARKIAINWSVQQKTITTLRNSSSKKIQSSETKKSQHKTIRDSTLFETDNSYFISIYIPEQETDTSQAIEKTLQDLQSQKEAIDTTIAVLQHRLNFLLNSRRAK